MLDYVMSEKFGLDWKKYGARRMMALIEIQDAIGRKQKKERDEAALQQVLLDVFQSYENFFCELRKKKEKKPYCKVGLPSFKSRYKDRLRFRIPQRVTIDNGLVSIPKVGLVRIRQSQGVMGATKSATFKRDATGKWFITVVTSFEIPNEVTPAREEHVVGIDLGVKTFAVLSDGTAYANPKFYKELAKKLRRAHRKLSRALKHSKNSEKARQTLALVYQKITQQRGDFMHKTTTEIVKNYDGFCIEDLNVAGMLRNHRLANSIANVALGEFKRQLTYKAKWAGKPIAVISRWFPSSKQCGACGEINHDLTWDDRIWTCASCNTVHDRDVNAARNIKAEGFKLMVAAGHTETSGA